MRDWIMRSWFRHPLSLRPFWHPGHRLRGVSIGLVIESIWDDGWHADYPLIVRVELWGWWCEFGIKDSN